MSVLFLGGLLTLIILFFFLAPVKSEYTDAEWENLLWENEQVIENKISGYFTAEQQNLLFVLEEVKKLTNGFEEIDSNRAGLINAINSNAFGGYHISIYKKNKIYAWTDNNNIPKDSLKIGTYELNEIHFRHTNLFTNLCVIDSFAVYHIQVSKPVEKYYILENEYSEILSLSKRFTLEFQANFKINYYPQAKLENNNFIHSFEILNNYNNKIGVVSFNKLNRDNEIKNIRSEYENILGVLCLLFVISIGFIFKQSFKKINKISLKFLIIFLYGFLIRYLFYYFDIPAAFISGWLVDTQFFSSVFAFGIVSTPLEFFLSVILLLLLSFKAFKYSFEFYQNNDREIKPYHFIIIGFLVFIYLASLRGLGATIRSVIFDSSLLYFKSTALLPDFPSAIMHFNMLTVGFCSIVFSIAILLIIFSYVKKNLEFKILTAAFFLLQLLGIFYDITQNEPQGTPLIRILYILFTYVLAVLLLRRKKIRKTYYVIFLFVASFITINLLNFYNLKLEKHTVKKVAKEFTAPNKTMVKNLIRNVFRKAEEELLDENLYINSEINFSAYSFIVWSNSSLHRNSMSSCVAFYDKSKILIGDFRFKFDQSLRDTLQQIGDLTTNDSIYFDEPTKKNHNVIRGVMPIYHDNDLEGYLVIKVNYGLDKTIFSQAPRFLSDLKSTYKSPVNLRDLKIFDFENGILTNVFGGINPGLSAQKDILSADLSAKKDTWKVINLSENLYDAYLLKYSEDKILVLALAQKDLTRNIFDFFKIFFVHTFFIFAIVIVMLLINYKEGRKFRYTFKAQLLTSFLVISIIPLIFLAIYFRDLQEEKNTSAIFYKLKKRAVSVESFVNSKLQTTDYSLIDISNMASADLGIEFSVYSEDELVYTSFPEYYHIGLMSDKLNPVAFNKLVLEGYNEFVNEEKVDEMQYNAFYYYGNIGDSYYIIKVNDILNAYLLPMSGTEVDIFLFGTYSFAAILIIIISTIIANQISHPIRRLTEATKSVAGGDLDLTLYQHSRGEVKELVDGFNAMIKDLRQNQLELAEMERETAWKEMAKQVAHEIKNPLTPMKLAVQQLIIAYKDKSPKFEDIFHKVTKTFDQQIDTLRNIANEFSNFARMPEPTRDNIDIIKIVNDAAHLFVDNRADIKVVSHNQDCQIIGDEDQLKRTIINMIRNSIQANATVIEIEIVSNENNKIIIADNGKGIPEDIQEKIFDANFTTKVEGMGLGLNMAKKYVEKIGGEIKIDKSDKHGTKFILKFPKV